MSRITNKRRYKISGNNISKTYWHLKIHMYCANVYGVLNEPINTNILGQIDDSISKFPLLLVEVTQWKLWFVILSKYTKRLHLLIKVLNRLEIKNEDFWSKESMLVGTEFITQMQFHLNSILEWMLQTPSLKKQQLMTDWTPTWSDPGPLSLL